MRCFTRVALGLALLGLTMAACRSGNEKQLLGGWISVARGQGGVATVVEFRPDGSFTSSFDKVLDCGYRMENGQLILTVPDAKTGQTASDFVQTRVEGDRLVFTAPWDGAEHEMQRSGPAPSSDQPLVGEWTAGATNARTAFADFSNDGKLSFRTRLKSATGTYKVSGDSLGLNFQGAPPQNGTFKIEGDSLIMTPEKGASQTFKRTQQ